MVRPFADLTVSKAEESNGEVCEYWRLSCRFFRLKLIASETMHSRSRFAVRIEESTTSSWKSTQLIRQAACHLEFSGMATSEECKFCVTVANPQSEDSPLIAVSEEFETMTGYSRNEILGVNCRFLNQGVDMNPQDRTDQWSDLPSLRFQQLRFQQDLVHLREASATGAPFTAILPNRKRSGELFLNLLDVRGLTVARRNAKTGEELWYLIGIQADVSELGEEQVPDDHFAELQMMSDFIRDRIIKELSQYALSTDDLGTSSSFDLLPTPEWRPGSRLGSRQLSAVPTLRPPTKSRTETRDPREAGSRMGAMQKLGLLSAVALGIASVFFLLNQRRALRPR
eukprot:Skav233276  [mRNA]  locus=scaffold3673:36406:41580:- [translate_table: standard]